MSRRPFFFRAPFGVVVLLILGAPSLAQERIGGAAAIQNDVRGAVSEGVTKLNVGDGVYANEVITTAADSSGRFTFKDRTDVQIGPVSRVKLDDFVYSGERPAVFSATKGVFRFISAPAAHGAYEVHTPTATIGVRGTSFGVRAVSGRTDAVLYGGVIEVCQASGGKCRTLDSPCTFVSVTNRGVTDPRKLGSKDWSFDNSCKLPRRSDNRPGDPGTPLPGDAPPAQPPLQWTGFHIGVTGGSSIGSTKFADPIPLDGAAFSGGLTLGYNWQATPNILVGFESDFGFRGGIGGGSNGVAVASGSGSGYLGTYRAVLGYAWNNIMAYGSGGLAYGNVVAPNSYVGQGVVGNFGTRVNADNAPLPGWAIGGGLEYAINDNWSVKAEYLYVRLAHDNPQYQTDFAAFYPASICNESALHVIRAGVNYHFNWSPPPQSFGQ